MTKTSIRSLALAICVMLFLATSSVQTQPIQRSKVCSVTSTSDLSGKPLAGNLGSSIDAALTEDGAELGRVFGVNPAIFYMQEYESPNASAIWARFPDLLAQEGRTSCCPDGTVLMGLELIKKEWAATGGTGLSIPAILAHEYAHIAQFKYNCSLQGKWRELHADYLAGWFTGHRGRFRPSSAFQAMANFYHKGDYDFNNSAHHGRPEERMNAFRAGFELNTRYNIGSGARAYDAGISYLKNRGA